MMMTGILVTKARNPSADSKIWKVAQVPEILAADIAMNLVFSWVVINNCVETSVHQSHVYCHQFFICFLYFIIDTNYGAAATCCQAQPKSKLRLDV